jgi:acyl-CoA thioester hydrolase
MYSYPIRVYYSDTDCGGIVYHARYLDFAEHARTEMLRDIGAKHGLEGSQSSLTATLNLAFVVKSINVDYEKPAHLDDLLEVRTELESAKRFSLVFRQTVLRSDEVLCTLLVRVAAINSETLRPMPMPAWFIPALQGA